MTRFYFDIHHDTQIIRDDVGSEFDSLEAAIQGAARSAAEIGTGRLVKGDLSNVVVEIRDAVGERVVTVIASMTIKRHDLPSQPPDP